MLCQDFNTKLVGLKGISIQNIEEKQNCIVIYGTTVKKEQVCPCCKRKSNLVHDYRWQKIRIMPIREKETFLWLRKRRYECSCGKKFLEKYEFLPKYHRMCKQVYEAIVTRMRSVYSMKDIAKEYFVSSNTVSRIFNIVNYKLNKLPEVVAIDEFKGNAGSKYQCIVTNPDKKKVLDILANREKNTVFKYFWGFNNRNTVKYVVMDMWKDYLEVSKEIFKNAKVVVDKYHYIRQVYWALDRVRKKCQKKLSADLRKYFKRSKRLLMAEYDKLGIENKKAVDVMLCYCPELQDAWQLKELFYEVRKSTSSKQARPLLQSWVETAKESRLEEFKDCTRAFTNWQEEILNSYDCPYTNGFTEGTNNKIKVLKRNAFGLRNFKRFRNRILHCCG